MAKFGDEFGYRPRELSAYVKWFVAGLVGLSVAMVLLLMFLPPSGIPAHWVCWRQSPGLIGLHLAGDLLVWSGYTAIPLLVLYLMVRGRIDESYPLSFPALVVWGHCSSGLADRRTFSTRWRSGIRYNGRGEWRS